MASSGSVTVPQVAASAPIPAYCRMPAQTLRKGKTDKRFRPRSGSLVLSGRTGPVRVDLNRDGRREVAVLYDCSAGGVAWPQLILVYTGGPTLAGHVNLGTRSGRYEHATVGAWSVSESSVMVKWVAYDGAGFNPQFHSSRLYTSGGRVAFGDRRPSQQADPLAKAVVARFLDAAVKKDTATMKTLATAKALKGFGTCEGGWRHPGNTTIVGGSQTFTPSVETTIACGKDAPGNWALIYTMATELDLAGNAKITNIVWGGDAG